MCYSDKREELIIQKKKSLQYLMSKIARIPGTAVPCVFVMLMCDDNGSVLLLLLSVHWTLPWRLSPQ